MKSTRIVCSLVVLSAPLYLDAAASSTSAKPDILHWEAVQHSSLINRTKSNLTKQPTALALKEAEHTTKFVTALAKLNKDIYLQELKTQHKRAPHYETPKRAPVEIAVDSTCYQDSSAEQRKTVLAQLKGTSYSLHSPIMLYHSNGKLVELNKYKTYNGGTVIWKSQPTEQSAEVNPPVYTLTALKNMLNASMIINDSNKINQKDAENAINLIEQLEQKYSPAMPKSQEVLTKQIISLAKQRDALFASLKLDPAQAYRIQAIIDYFKIGSSEEEIFNEAFGTTNETMNNRPAVVRMLAEVERHVQDPNKNAWLAGTYEPRAVKELKETMTALEKETDNEAKCALRKKCDILATTIHNDAIKSLNGSIKQEKITTDKLRAETKPFEAQVGELRNVLRHIHELQMIQAALQDNAAASSSAASSSAAN